METTITRADDLTFHEQIDPHHQASRLSEIILGGQDGLVNVLGVILGVAAATSDARIVLAAGFAAAFAESVSMGAVAYTSTQAQATLYASEKLRELRHIERVPDLEREEIRSIYQKKGFQEPVLGQIVEQITQDPEVWVNVMMAEELNLAPVSRGAAWQAAVVVGISAIIGSLIPLTPFILLPVQTAMWVSIIVAAVTLFAVGAYNAHATIGNVHRSGLEMAIIGIASALVGYAVGLLFRVPVVP